VNKVYRKISLITVLCLLISVFLWGCGAQGSNDSKDSTVSGTAQATGSAAGTDSQDTYAACTLKYYSPSSENVKELNEALPDFNKKFPTIKIDPVIVNDSNFDVRIRTAIMAGEQIDIVETASNTLDRAGAAALYYPLDDLARKANIDPASIYGDYTKQMTVNGVLYALPKGLAPAGMCINKKQFEEANIPLPTADWTFDDFYNIAKQLTVKDKSGAVTRYGFYDWTLGTDTILNMAFYGGWQLLKDDGSLNDLNSPIFRKSLEFYYNAVVKDQIAPSDAVMNSQNLNWKMDFYKGKWSMLMTGRNALLFIDEEMDAGKVPEGTDGDFTMAYIPRFDANSPAKQAIDISTGDSIVKSCKNPREAFEFLKWHTTDAILLSSKVTHRIPAAKTLDMNILMQNWSYYPNSDGQLVMGKDRSDIYKMVLDPEIKPIFPENMYKYSYSNLAKDALDKRISLLLAGESTVDKTIEEATKDLQQVIDKEKSNK
jgi:ABC-type sugar transport system, periplasmic component